MLEKKKAAPSGTAFTFCIFLAEECRRELLAVDSVSSGVSSFFRSVGDGFSSVASSFSGCVGCAFSSFASVGSSAFDSVANGFSVGFSVCSHCVDSFASGVSGFAASSEAQSRRSDSGSKNDLTHNFNSLFSE